ncbi:MAG: hypothetical protein ABSH51_19500 [Solirubrobacteraceae bacterium]|jgi:hypothetical protein
MASRGKKKTTMAKLTRESRLRERRLEKKVRKDVRKQASSDRAQGIETIALDDDDVELAPQVEGPLAS